MNRNVALLRRFEDPADSRDPRIRSLIEDLGRLDYAPAPRADFRADLRAQLVAITERMVAEGDPATTTQSAVVAAASGATGTVTDGATVVALEPKAKRRSFARPVGIAAACVAVLALGFGAAVWKSQSALPGDSLYGLKLASESARLSLTSGNTDRGHEYLSLATTRVQEAQDLLGHDSALASGAGYSAAGVSPETVHLIQTALRSADADLKSGSSLLTAQAVASHSPAPLAIMTSWAPGQAGRLATLATSLASGPAAADAEHSLALVKAALDRARTFSPGLAGGCTATDGRGPASCATAPSAVTTGHPATNAASAHPGSSSSTASGANHQNSGTSGTGTSSNSGTPAPTRTLPIPTLPTTVPTSLPSLPRVLPTSSPSLGLSIVACGVTALGVTIRSCPSGS